VRKELVTFEVVNQSQECKSGGEAAQWDAMYVIELYLAGSMRVASKM
jgi:hypothetical protein